MKRFDYERRLKTKKNAYKSEQRYYIYDRYCGAGAKLATAYNAADAEKICAALNQCEASR